MTAKFTSQHKSVRCMIITSPPALMIDELERLFTGVSDLQLWEEQKRLKRRGVHHGMDGTRGEG